MKNITKGKKLERKIASLCENKTIQFNKWKLTDLFYVFIYLAIYRFKVTILYCVIFYSFDE